MPTVKGSLLDFLTDVCCCLFGSDVSSATENLDNEESAVKTVRSWKANTISDAVRYDKVNHWPLQCEDPQHCKNPGCKRRSRFFCSKCQLYLCVTGTDCFLKFHGVDTK